MYNLYYYKGHVCTKLFIPRYLHLYSWNEGHHNWDPRLSSKGASLIINWTQRFGVSHELVSCFAQRSVLVTFFPFLSLNSFWLFQVSKASAVNCFSFGLLIEMLVTTLHLYCARSQKPYSLGAYSTELHLSFTS
jgi:hypothetical protein